MNNQNNNFNKSNQNYYTVMRDGKEIKIPASEFLSTGGLSVPSTPYIPTQEEKWNEETRNTQYADYSGQPTVNSILDPYLQNNHGFIDDWDTPPQEIQEGDTAPTLPIYNGRELLK